MSRKRSSVQKYHDRVAGVYDHSYEDGFWQWHDSLTWDSLKPHLPRNLSACVIDLGCGTGKWGLKLLKSGYKVTFVDISAEMLDQARAKAAEMGSKSATFVRADIADLSEFAEGTFALAVAFGEPIGCTPQPPRTLKQIHRILKADGTLVATFDNRLAAIDYYLSIGDVGDLGRFLREGRTHWLTKDSTERFPIMTYAPNQLESVVHHAGFDVISLLGKSVLPMRHHRELLATSESRRAWAAVEKSLARDRDALSRAPHLQIACQKSAERDE